MSEKFTPKPGKVEDPYARTGNDQVTTTRQGAADSDANRTVREEQNATADTIEANNGPVGPAGSEGITLDYTDGINTTAEAGVAAAVGVVGLVLFTALVLGFTSKRLSGGIK